MSALLRVLRHEPRARVFLLAYAQSSAGTWAGNAAIVVLAYERFRSPWSITLVLLASMVPAMLLGPLFGAVADRWSRRGCMIAADVVRAGACIGVGLGHNFEATVGCSLLLGLGTGLFSPAALAALPSLVADERVGAVTSLYGGASDLGRTLGPALAALAFPLVGADGVMLADGATFAASAAAIAALGFGGAPARAARHGLLAEARAGLVTTARTPVVRVVLWASSAAIVFAAMTNVGELLLARRLGAGAAGYSWLIAVFGCGLIAGSLLGARGGSDDHLVRRYTTGLMLMGSSLVALALVPSFGLALPLFAASGVANGLFFVHERLLYQRLVPDGMRSRAFAALDTLGAWAFALAFVSAGAIALAGGPRGLMAIAGGGCLAVWAAAALAFRRERRAVARPPARQPAYDTLAVGGTPD